MNIKELYKDCYVKKEAVTAAEAAISTLIPASLAVAGQVGVNRSNKDDLTKDVAKYSILPSILGLGRFHLTDAAFKIKNLKLMRGAVPLALLSPEIAALYPVVKGIIDRKKAE